MPNKSDSAGKIHEYYTYLEAKGFYNIEGSSPFDQERHLHIELFSESEINNLKLASRKTFEIIKDHLLKNYPNTSPVKINHIGETSGAGVQNNTDDLLITLSNDEKVTFSLKCATSNGSVLSRNMGAKSLLKNYFSAEKEQVIFNKYFNAEHLVFLNKIFDTNFSCTTEAKQFIKEKTQEDGHDKDRFEYYPKAIQTRDLFLPKLPNKLLDVIQALDVSKIVSAANLILDAGSNIIFATYGETISVDSYCTPTQNTADFIATKLRDNRSVVLELKNFNIGFRYKFESSITSSIKLVGDYTQK